MSILLQMLGLEDASSETGTNYWKPNPSQGDYRDLKPAHTQVHKYGKDFVDNAAARDYARTSGKTKICPHCFNDPLKRCSCSTCHHTGEVDINFGVF